MQTVPLSNFDLYVSADAIVNTYKTLDNQLYMYFDLLRDSGARAHEGLEFERWISKNEFELELIGEKGALNRLIPRSNIQSNFADYVDSGNDPFTFLSYTQMVRYLRKGSLYRIYYPSGRSLNAHLFRHVFVRKLIDAGKTEAQIKVILGKPPDANISTYYNTIFYKYIQ